MFEAISLVFPTSIFFSERHGLAIVSDRRSHRSLVYKEEQARRRASSAGARLHDGGSAGVQRRQGRQEQGQGQVQQEEERASSSGQGGRTQESSRPRQQAQPRDPRCGTRNSRSPSVRFRIRGKRASSDCCGYRRRDDLSCEDGEASAAGRGGRKYSGLLRPLDRLQRTCSER